MDNDHKFDRMEWEEFRSSGLLWFINSSLHIFGVALVLESDKEGNITAVYPARTNVRGFTEGANNRGFKRMSNFMKTEADRIIDDCEDL